MTQRSIYRFINLNPDRLIRACCECWETLASSQKSISRHKRFVPSTIVSSKGILRSNGKGWSNEVTDSGQPLWLHAS
ncbi:conserved hypothetical protein [Coccidioides posadasii str. Silveira]|uniref:Uncharacterized protein n=1 Tax=Coccidioides posadasii (strain RMSCC 757 / Silveira) TaxID=443226 RepID=E9DIZ5_COCPS|nr:conserved hypothetical protein [Coccidioides posadasii str. Silveira]